MAYKIIERTKAGYTVKQHNLPKAKALEETACLRKSGGNFLWSKQRGLHIECPVSECPACLNEIEELIENAKV